MSRTLGHQAVNKGLKAISLVSLLNQSHSPVTDIDFSILLYQVYQLLHQPFYISIGLGMCSYSNYYNYIAINFDCCTIQNL